MPSDFPAIARDIIGLQVLPVLEYQMMYMRLDVSEAHYD